MLFRFHRGSLVDSMSTVREINGKEELESICRNYTLSDIKPEIKFYGHDNRINWNCYVVTVKGFGVVGFTNAPVV